MGKLYFRYSTMNAGKSAHLLQTSFNYRECNVETLLFLPSIDNRANGKISSRIGISSDAILISKSDDPEVFINEKTQVVFIDEAQFLTSSQVEKFAYIVDKYNICVFAYGLRLNFKGELFEGSKALLAIADNIEELKTICPHCGKKATHVLRFFNGKPIFDGEEVLIGGNESYQSCCRKHFYELKKND